MAGLVETWAQCSPGPRYSPLKVVGSSPGKPAGIMGNCAAARLIEGCGDGEDPVALCRDRKRFMKAAVEARFALAAAHGSYAEALRAVAAALDLFVARYSSPAPVLITLPERSESDAASPPLTPKAPLLPSSNTPPFYSPPPARDPEPEPEPSHFSEFSEPVVEIKPPPPAVSGWDFFNFNPFYGEVMSEFVGLSEEDLSALREREGIPDLEEVVEEEKEAVVNESKKEMPMSVTVQVENNVGRMEVTEAVERKELLEALKSVETHFTRACEASAEVARLLEVNKLGLHSGIDELKENSSKIIQAITWHRCPSSSSSSYRSHLALSTSSASWSDGKSDPLDDYGGMKSGSHSETLERLYVWEKKLYEEVKAVDQVRILYKKKCAHLTNQDAKGAGQHATDKTRSMVRDLYTRIWVALRAAQSISNRIEKLRDDELHPQLIELLQSLMQSYQIMLDSHEAQKQMMFEVNTFSCPTYGKVSNEAQRHATLKLEAELRNWRSCFASYMAAQKSYVGALDGWLSKFVLPGTGRSYSQEERTPPLISVFRNWSAALAKLPEKPVSFSMKSFVKSVRFLSVKQAEEQQQKRKADALTREIDKRSAAFKRAEGKLLEAKLLDHKPEQDMRQRIDSLSEKREVLEACRRRLNTEREKHRLCMQDTHNVTLNGFKIGLAGIFESLTVFSRESLGLYSALLLHLDVRKAQISGPGMDAVGPASGDGR